MIQWARKKLKPMMVVVQHCYDYYCDFDDFGCDDGGAFQF